MTNFGVRAFVWLAVTFVALLVTSCRQSGGVDYSHFEQIGSEGWDPLDQLVFEPWPMDSVLVPGRTYRMRLVFRYSTLAKVPDLPLAVTVEDENGVMRSDTIVINHDGDSSVARKTKYGVREFGITLDPSVALRDGYAVTLSPLASREQTQGLLNVGIILTRGADSITDPVSSFVRRLGL